MKFKKFILTFTVVLLFFAYFGTDLLPGVFNSVNGLINKSALTPGQRIDISARELEGMQSLSRSSSIYYEMDGSVPTNKVWSSAIFHGELTGLYTFPFASNTKDGILNITVPKKYAYEKLITAQITGESISIKGEETIDKVYVKSFSDLSVTFSFKGFDDNEIYSATFVQGSPYIYIKPNKTNLFLSSQGFQLNEVNNVWVFSQENNNNIGVFTEAKVENKNNTLELDFDNNQYLTLGFYTNGNYDLINTLAGNIVKDVWAEYSIDKDKVITKYKTNYETGNETILGLLPHHYRFSNDELSSNEYIFSTNTLRGDQKFFKVRDSISYSVPRMPIIHELIPKDLNEEEKVYIGSLIERDLKDLVFVRDSIYFGGNDMLKLARLLEISNEIGRTDLADSIKARLNDEFDDWVSYSDGETSKYFAFDKAWGGIIGYDTGGFGGEKYNDHHFQYGYFIHAASILAKYDENFLTKYKTFINGLVLDIANNQRDNQTFPYLRYFDQYEGHSWATGFSDFSDGSNQESSSEAINAWYGVWLWSEVVGDKELENTAEYLYSNEINSARNYWLNWYEDPSIFPSEYKRLKASNLFGGKFEYQTWFSLEPQAIEAIQYLPITPGSLYLYDKDVLQRDYDYFQQYISDLNSHLIDFNYLYYAMLNGFEILPKDKIENMKIDPAQSRANMYMWTRFWNDIDHITPELSEDKMVYRIFYK